MTEELALWIIQLNQQIGSRHLENLIFQAVQTLLAHYTRDELKPALILLLRTAYDNGYIFSTDWFFYTAQLRDAGYMEFE